MLAERFRSTIASCIRIKIFFRRALRMRCKSSPLCGRSAIGRAKKGETKTGMDHFTSDGLKANMIRFLSLPLLNYLYRSIARFAAAAL